MQHLPTKLAFAILSIFLFCSAHTASASTIIPYASNITGNVTWTKAGSPYIVEGMGVAAGAMLTIEPGAIVKLQQGGGVGVVGNLIIGAPAPAEPVIITSIKDDTGGDDNGDGALTTPAAGDWGAFFLFGTTTTITNTTMRYGGRSASAFLINQGSELTISGSTLSDSVSGVVLGEWGKTNIDTSSFGVAANGINMIAGSFGLATSTFTSLVTSVNIDGAVQFVNHGGNTGSGGYELSGMLYGDQVWNKDGLPYLIQSFGTAATSSLTMLPGTVVKFHQGGGFGAAGAIVIGAEGSSDPVLLTSYRDDSVLGDTNNDGVASSPLPGDWNGIYLFSTSTIAQAHFSYGGSIGGALNNYGGALTLSGGKIEKSGGANFFQHAGTSTLVGTALNTGTYGAYVDGGNLTIHNSSVTGNTQYGILNATSHDVNATENWWGAFGGPTHPSNPFGTGDNVTDNVDFGQWLTTAPGITPAPCTIDCYSNVLFLPGIEASRLYAKDDPNCSLINCENQLWEPNRNEDVRKLYLDANGKSTTSYDIYTRDIIDRLNIIHTNVYDSFIISMNDLKNNQHKINDWQAIPYDWRLSMDDIISGGVRSGDNISYVSSTSHSYIVGELQALAAHSKTGKVTIIAHSNGGLVTKALMLKLRSLGEENLVDKIIFVDVPQEGTPEAIGALLHGMDQGHFLILNTENARTFMHNAPVVYNLLPSQGYFTGEGGFTTTPVVTFSGSPQTAVFYNSYGNEINTFGAEQAFVLGIEGRQLPGASNVIYPNIGNQTLLVQSQMMHQQLDAWQPPIGVKLFQIAGWGVNTLATIKYKQGSFFHCLGISPCLDYDLGLTEDGDGTVVIPSMLALSPSTDNITRLWVNLNKYNASSSPIDHSNILELPSLRSYITDILTDTINPVENYTYLSKSSPPSSSVKKLSYFLHSPLTLDLYDNQGRHTGISSSTGAIDNQIPGAYYRTFGEVKYITALASSAIHLAMNGQASGHFTLDVQEVIGNTITATTSFVDIPTATTTKVTMDFTDGTIAHASPLHVDEDGNGTIDFNLVPMVGNIVTLPPLDITPPITTALTTGTLGKNNWYKSNVLVALTATDTASGVATTSYSINNGVTWLAYSSAFLISKEGTSSVLYYSTDKAGNREATNTLQLKIDKTAPEAGIAFDPVRQQISIIGSDNLSSTTAVTTASSSLITDAAGHTLRVVFTDLKPKTKLGRINMVINALVYDNATTTLSNTTFKYKWSTTTPATTYKVFAAFLTTSSTSTEAHYRPKKGVTIIMSTPIDLDDTDADDACDARPTKNKLTGLVVPGLFTNKGSVNINY